MKMVVAITSESSIRRSFKAAASAMEEENQIHFPNNNARAEFIEDCVSSEIDKFELYGSDPFSCQTNYTTAILDMARIYGYLVG